MRLKGKTALIAGASRNIGKEIALTFAREGADLVLISRKMDDDLKQAARDCESRGVRALPVAADVGDPEAVNRAVRQAQDHYGKVDVLVSVAAIRPHKPFWEISNEEWNQVLAVNLSATFYLAKALAPGWIERRTGGSIVAIGGMASLTSQPNRAHVIASMPGYPGREVMSSWLAVMLGERAAPATTDAPKE